MTLDPEAFERGRKAGRQEAIDELAKILDLDERIAKAIALHEEREHGYET